METDDSDVVSYLDEDKDSATREPCDNTTRMSDAPVSHKSGFVDVVLSSVGGTHLHYILHTIYVALADGQSRVHVYSLMAIKIA
jgi:hypothetical protein